jgi:uncharacterized Fe-S cluster-containing radical SAM superfamily protein
MKPQEFKRQLDELRTIITDGIAYFSAWRGLTVEDEVSAHALNRYRGLFLPARNALLWMTFMQFAKVFDPDTRTISLRNLLIAAKADRENLTPHANEENLQKLEEQIDTNEDLLQRLKSLRDQRIAHHDAKITGDTRLLYGETRKLVEAVKSIYNSLTSYHDRSITSFEYLVREAERHTAEVVQIMREDRDKRLQRFKKSDTAT